MATLPTSLITRETLAKVLHTAHSPPISTFPISLVRTRNNSNLFEETENHRPTMFRLLRKMTKNLKRNRRTKSRNKRVTRASWKSLLRMMRKLRLVSPRAVTKNLMTSSEGATFASRIYTAQASTRMTPMLSNQMKNPSLITINNILNSSGKSAKLNSKRPRTSVKGWSWTTISEWAIDIIITNSTTN